ncbi:hypothetical protein [Grimontia hollisae]|uniref:hypothetical protein n=1 Tax=Grimontia hollisae TaxID=673 RepID=UPI0013032EDF|nr:hypothetical protein [Grimontia hollisae]
MKTKMLLLTCLSIFICNVSFAKESDSQDLTPSFVNHIVDNEILDTENDSILSFGVSSHRIKAGRANGFYVSGLIPIGDTDFGVYGRGNIISDKYKTGHFWSWNMAVGAGYYLNDSVIPLATVGKCFSNYSTCYFNTRHPTANDDDIDAIYYGLGAYIKDPFFNGMWEISGDWSPYKGYNGMSLYIGYGVKF